MQRWTLPEAQRTHGRPILGGVPGKLPRLLINSRPEPEVYPAWSSHHQFLSRCNSIVFTAAVVVSPFFHWQIFCPVSKATEGETKCVNCLWFRNQVACQWIANWLHSTWEPLQEWTCLPRVKIRLSLLLFSYWNEETQKLIFSVQKLFICNLHCSFRFQWDLTHWSVNQVCPDIYIFETSLASRFRSFNIAPWFQIYFWVQDKAKSCNMPQVDEIGGWKGGRVGGW